MIDCIENYLNALSDVISILVKETLSEKHKLNNRDDLNGKKREK